MGICGATTNSGNPCQNSTDGGNCHLHDSGMNTNLRGEGSTLGSRLGRQDFASQAGLSFGTDRDIYEVLGYPESLQYDDYWDRYRRQDIAGRIVDAAPKTTWRKEPEIQPVDSGEDKTEFEKQFESLNREHSIFTMLERVDRLSRIGEYAIMVLGTDDVTTDEDFEDPLSTPANLEYLSVFGQDHITDVDLEDEATSERFGRPKKYSVKFADPNIDDIDSAGTQQVHHSRVIHVAGQKLDNDVYGFPVLQRIFNMLIALDHVAGGAQESFWRMANRGIHIDIDPEAVDVDTDALQDEIQSYIHNMQRFIRTRGADVQSLGGDDVDPSNVFDMLISLITGAREDIPPKGILLGRERSDVADKKEQQSWYGVIANRQTELAGPSILRPLIDKLIFMGELPETQNGYEINWPALFTQTEKEKAEVSQSKAKALAALTKASMNDPNITPEVIEQIVDVDLTDVSEDVANQLESEDRDIEELADTTPNYNPTELDPEQNGTG